MEAKTFDLKEYLSWLSEYSKEHNIIKNMMLCNNSLKDSKYIYSMRLFFDRIDDYAKKNYLVPNINKEEDTSYFIKDKEKFYQVGYCYMGEYCYYIKTIEPRKSYIDADDIISNKVLPQTKDFEKRLKALEAYIENCLNMGITSDTIKDMTNKILVKSRVLK